MSWQQTKQQSELKLKTDIKRRCLIQYGALNSDEKVKE